MHKNKCSKGISGKLFVFLPDYVFESYVRSEKCNAYLSRALGLTFFPCLYL